MIYLLDNNEIKGQFQTINGTTYPSDWLILSTDSEREKIGVITLTEIWPALTDGQSYDGTYVDDLIALTRTYTIIS